MCRSSTSRTLIARLLRSMRQLTVTLRPSNPFNRSELLTLHVLSSSARNILPSFDTFPERLIPLTWATRVLSTVALDWAIVVSETATIKARMATENRLIFDPLLAEHQSLHIGMPRYPAIVAFGKSKLLMGAISLDYGPLALGPWQELVVPTLG